MSTQTTTQAKTSKFSEAMVQRIKEVYNPASDEAARRAQVEQLATEFGEGFSARSIIGKLGTMKNKQGLPLYVPYEKKVTTTKTQASRAELRRNLESILAIQKNTLESFDRVNRGQLEALVSAIVALTPESKEAPDTSEA